MNPGGDRSAGIREFAIKLASVLTALACWEIVARSGWVNRPLFPAPSEVALAMLQWARSGELLTDIASSLWHAFAGYLVGASLGMVMGILTGRSALLSAIASPVLQILRPIPPVAIIPLVILWLGIGDAAKVSSTAFAVFFPVWVAAHAGSRGVPELYLWSARTLGASRLRQLWSVVFPAALPTIQAGLRIGVTTAFVMVFVTELAGASSGLGYQIATSQAAYRVDRMMAAILVLAAIAALSDVAQRKMFRAIFPWLQLVELR